MLHISQNETSKTLVLLTGHVWAASKIFLHEKQRKPKSVISGFSNVNMYVSNTYITNHFQKKKNTRKKKKHPENKPDTQRHTHTQKKVFQTTMNDQVE